MRRIQIFVFMACTVLLIQCDKTPDLTFSSIEYLDENGVVRNVEIGGGKKTVIHFFASWCGDCKREMPDANKLLSK